MIKSLVFLALVLSYSSSYAVNELRISLVGNSAVGKTALLDHLRGREFIENSIFSGGIDFTIAKSVVDLEDVEFVVFDTPGLPYYRDSILPIIRNNLDGAIIVFDLTKFDSLTSIKSWTNFVYKISKKDIPIVIIGNKADNKKQRIIGEDISETFAKYNLKYMETSAKDGPGIYPALAYIGKNSRKRFKSIRSLSLPISLDEEIYFKGIEPNPIEMLMFLLDKKNNPHKFETSLSDYFFQDQLSHQHLINNALTERLENYTAFCLNNISKIRKLEHKMTKITHYRIFSFIVSLGINLSFESKELFELLYQKLQRQDLEFLNKILIEWDELIDREFAQKFYLMEYLKVENDFHLLLSSARKISYEILGCSRWADELGVEEQLLLMNLENLETKSLQRIVSKLRNSPDGIDIVQDILDHSEDIDSPYFRSGGRYASLSDLVCTYIKEPNFD